MKKVLLASILVSSSLLASEQNYIEFGGGVINSKDNFSTENKNNNPTLNNADNESMGIAYLEFFYGYDLTDSLNIYAKSGVDGFKVGTNYKNFDFGLKADISEEWENPFQTGTKRKETDVSEFGLYAAYGFSANTNHDGAIRYEFSGVNYEKETVIDDLKREGNRHIVSFENLFRSKLIDKDVTYFTNLSYEKYDADGKASSYDRYDFLLGASTSLNEKVSLSLFTNVGKKAYEKKNIEVDKKVDVDIYGVNAILNWDKPFNYENTYVNLKTGYEKEEANVDFYDKENSFGLISVGYKF